MCYGLFMVTIIEYPQKVNWKQCVVAIGNFDGVHEGHRALLAVARGEAEKRGIPLVPLTFEPHPREVLFPDVPLRRLTDKGQKADILGRLGDSQVAILAFDRTVAGWCEQFFRDEVLVGWLRAACVVVGEDFRYGHKADGSVVSLRSDGRFDTVVVPLVRDAAGEVVSSRRLREMEREIGS
jgi:riboflavin kinase / FMN adenylyltransferase